MIVYNNTNQMEFIGFLISIFGTLITIVGLIVAIVQINKTKKISAAAYSAASEAKKAIKNTIVISDLSTKIKIFQEIQNYILNIQGNPPALPG